MRAIDVVAAGGLIFASLMAAGCGDSKTGADAAPSPASTAAATRKPPMITAAPNPVPAGDGFGSTKITWETGGPWGQVFISMDGMPDTKMFGEGARASGDATWIQSGHTYEFRLFAGKDHSQLLDKVLVTRTK